MIETGLICLPIIFAPPPSQPRVPASSVAQKTTLPKAPRITTQLNPAWMSQAAGTRLANDTFADGKPPLILGVAECPSWPEFRLSESTRTCELLGTNLAAVEYYNVKFCLWTRIDISYTHILTPDTYLLRRIGVSGLDEDRLIDHFVNLPGPQHIRYDLTDAVRHKLKVRPTKANSEDEVEIVGSMASRLSLTRILPSPTVTSSAPPKWPAGIYTIDMANGFLRMEAADMQHIPPAQRFQQVFKTTSEYKRRTYTDARLRWTRGSESLRTAPLDAGRTREGLWSAYAAQVPLRK
ncbi:hypothetical protein B0H13DRAFT_2390169 [Mycena leptocephala]|nr:hypothetical protein B0H13DRAFT_2390169 [Mycena leptocephala]